MTTPLRRNYLLNQQKIITRKNCIRKIILTLSTKNVRIMAATHTLPIITMADIQAGDTETSIVAMLLPTTFMVVVHAEICGMVGDTTTSTVIMHGDTMDGIILPTLIPGE